MKTPISIYLFFLLTTTFTLKGQIQCENDSTGNIPLVDLKTGFYLGAYQGGLYPGGKNTPPKVHLKKGLQISKGIKPLDSLGNVNYAEGKIVFAGFGGSTTGEPFNHLIEITMTDSAMNPCLYLLNATNAGEGMEGMTLDNPNYWDIIYSNRLEPKGITPEQIQIAWLFQGSRADTIFDMPAYAETIKDRIRVSLNSMWVQYPNLKIVYVASPYYGGYADPTFEIYKSIHEPGAYRCGFGYKWAMEAQITGDPNFKYMAPGKVMPYMIWGPYTWTDGIKPRDYDSLYWNCEEDFSFDGGGFHLNGAGKDKLAHIWNDFFKTDTLSEIWYNDGPKWGSCGDGRAADGSIFSSPQNKNTEFIIYPTVSTGIFTITAPEGEENYFIKIYNSRGETIWNSENSGENIVTVNLTDKPSGTYFCLVSHNDQYFTKQLIITK